MRWILCLLPLLLMTLRAEAQGKTWVPLDGTPPGTAAQVLLDRTNSDANHTVFEVDIHGFWTEPEAGPGGAAFVKIDIPGLQVLDVIGAPHLPIVRGLLAVPTDATAATFAGMIPLSEPLFFTLHLWPEPIDARQGETEIPEVFMLDPIVYGTPGPYPATAGTGNAVLLTQGCIPAARVDAYPCRWDPTTDGLEIFPRSRWEFDHAGGVRPFGPITRDRPQLCSVMMNWNSVQQLFPVNRSQYQGEYLIVYPKTYLGQVTAMIAQEKTRGFTVAQIQTDTLGTITCDAIRSAIRNWYLFTPPNADHYCLLVGDVNQIPLCNTGTSLDPVWTDDQYGIMNNNYTAADIFVGRLSPNDATDLNRQINKIIHYESFPVASPVYYRYVLLVAHKEGEFETAQDSVFTHGYAVPPIFSKIYGANAQSSNAGVSNEVNTGEGITCYRGHGGPEGWYQWDTQGQSYQYSDVDLLLNGSLTTVVWTIACNNSYLFFDHNSIGLHWMSKWPGGAVSHYGATLPSDRTPNTQLEWSLFEAVWDKGITIQGQAISWAETQMVLAYNQGGGKNMLLYTLLGDPSMAIRREGPKNWDLLHASQLAIVSPGQMEGLDFRILDALGRPVDALVSLWKGGAAGGGSAATTATGDEVFDNKYTDAQGWAHFEVSPTSTGFLYFAVRDTAGNAMADSIPVGATSGVPDSRVALHVFRALPSVTHGDVHWVFGAPVESPGEVSVFAIDGRHAATLPVPAGSMDVDWRETDAGGRPVASGVYIARFRSPTWSATARVLLLR